MINIQLEMQTLRSALTNLLQLGVSRNYLRQEVKQTMDNWQRKLTTRKPVQTGLPGPGDFDPPESNHVDFDGILMEEDIRDYLENPQVLGDLLAFESGPGSATEMMTKYLWSHYCGVCDETTAHYEKKMIELLRNVFEKEIEELVNGKL